jgi:spermidine synthase
MAALGENYYAIMKQPFWKRFLSHLFEIHIESTSSEHNPHLYVSLRKGRYQLSTANAIYSFEDLYYNFSDAFTAIDLDKMDIQNVLILGFGLGSIPVILEQNFKKKYHYTGIEIDEEVLYLASKYALPEISSGVELICANAIDFVNQSTQKYDMIAVDLFQDDIIPEQFEQLVFLENLKKLLTPKGAILYNRLAHNAEDIKQSKSFYHDAFIKVFTKGTYLEVNDNWMLLNRKDILK